MPHCCYCAKDLQDADEMCPHHDSVIREPEWHVNNRVMCDILHRREDWPRLPPDQRFWFEPEGITYYSGPELQELEEKIFGYLDESPEREMPDTPVVAGHASER